MQSLESSQPSVDAPPQPSEVMTVQPEPAWTVRAKPGPSGKLQPWSQGREEPFRRQLLTNNWRADGQTSRQLSGPSWYDIDFDSTVFRPIPKYFVGRASYLDCLSKFVHSMPAAMRKVIALWGSSGMGKTQLARVYARNHSGSNHSASFLVDAQTTSTMNHSFGLILAQIWKTWPDLDSEKPGSVPSDVALIRELVYTWLAKPQNPRWLVVFDNASEQRSLAPFPSKAQHGTVIITTQSPRFTESNQLFPGDTTPAMELEVSTLSFQDGKHLIKGIAEDLYTESDTRKQALDVLG